jgi:hypothetical protein
MLYFTEQVCRLLPKQLTNLSAAFKAADKKMTKNWAYFLVFLYTYCVLFLYILSPSGPDQGCQMTIFKQKIPIWVNFGGQWKMLVHFIAIVACCAKKNLATLDQTREFQTRIFVQRDLL